MQPFRFIQCGDLHLGAPFHYLKSIGKSVDQAVALATYRSFEAIVDWAIEERVQAFLITGDAYNSKDHNLEAQVRFVRAVERLAEVRIPVYMVQGNHDPAESWRAQITLPENVHVFSSKQVQRFPLMVNNLGIGGIYGMSCGEGNETTNFAKQYKAFESDDFSIAVMHGTVGAATENSEVKINTSVGPCNVSDLTEAAMDYWAIGHIHKRQIVNEEPYVVYAGNPQGLHKKERGPKGAYLVSVSNNGHCELEFKETCAIRFERATIDISSLKNEADMMEMIRHKKDMLRNNLKKPVLLEIVLTGTGALHRLCAQEDVRQMWLADSQEEDKGRSVFIMPYVIVDETSPAIDLEERRKLSDMVGDYLSAYDETIHHDVTNIRAILAERPEFKRLGRYADFLSDEVLSRAARRAEIEGVTKLMGANDED